MPIFLTWNFTLIKNYLTGIFFKKVHNSDSNPAKCQIPSTIAEGGVQES